MGEWSKYPITYSVNNVMSIRGAFFQVGLAQFVDERAYAIFA